jgi:hypothetical protein
VAAEISHPVRLSFVGNCRDSREFALDEGGDEPQRAEAESLPQKATDATDQETLLTPQLGASEIVSGYSSLLAAVICIYVHIVLVAYGTFENKAEWS